MSTFLTNLKNQTALSASALCLMASGAAADVQHLDDVIITQSLCVGNDCVNGESFGFDTLRLKENNLRLNFDDTSSSGSFPSNDWRITVNDSANGGASYFGVEDASAGRIPFRVEAGAPANALYVDDGGRIGAGTASPVVEMHVVDGNSPTIRLEQDGSSGFTPQTYDIAANESNFFIRDVTNGSRLFFRAQPGAPANSIFIKSDGNIGLGTNAPAKDLHIRKTGSDNVELQLEQTAGGATQYRMITSNGNNRRIVGLSADGVPEAQINLGDQKVQFYAGTTLVGEIDSTGFSVGGTQLNVPDYVFDAAYDLRPLHEVRAFIQTNSHLPDVPSAAKINAGALNMTAMQMTLLRKVEELTLYTLAQEDKITVLENRLQNSTE